VSQGIQRAAFLEATFGEVATHHSVDFSKMLPVFPDVIKSIANSSYRWLGDSKDTLDSIPQQAVVFVGGGFDPRDNFLTVQGIEPGVIFHASVQATDALGVRKLSTILAFIFNFVLGVVAGYLFNWAWTRQNQSMLSKSKAEGNNWFKYLKARGWLFINIAILLSWVGVLFSLTASLLKAQLWANPIAMIIGVFIKTMTSSRKGLDGQSLISKHPDWSKLDSVTLIGDFVLTAPVIIYGIYLTFFK
jgi:membrane protein YqaA with SNARE-associated domain